MHEASQRREAGILPRLEKTHALNLKDIFLNARSGGSSCSKDKLDSNPYGASSDKQEKWVSGPQAKKKGKRVKGPQAQKKQGQLTR